MDSIKVVKQHEKTSYRGHSHHSLQPQIWNPHLPLLQLPSHQIPHPLRLLPKPKKTNPTIQQRLVHHDVPPPQLVRLWTLAHPICYSCSADFADVHRDVAKGFDTGWRECGDAEYR